MGTSAEAELGFVARASSDLEQRMKPQRTTAGRDQWYFQVSSRFPVPQSAPPTF